MNFKIDKNGYNINEVENYIANLKNEYDRSLSEQKIRISDLKREIKSKTSELLKYKSKNSDISNALIVAVETARQIENSSKNVYELEIKRIRSLYDKWDKMFDEFIREYPALSEKFDSKKLLKALNDKIDEVVSKNGINIENSTQSQQPIGIRNLIGKMGGIAARQIANDQTLKNETKKSSEKFNVIDSNEHSVGNVDEEYDIDRSNFELKIKPIANMTRDEKEKFDNLIEKFFDKTDDEDDAYSKALIREKKQVSGFNLKEALNPTEDLAEIMKDFGFFDDDKK